MGSKQRKPDYMGHDGGCYWGDSSPASQCRISPFPYTYYNFCRKTENIEKIREWVRTLVFDLSDLYQDTFSGESLS